jgi:hypothetical protein
MSNDQADRIINILEEINKKLSNNDDSSTNVVFSAKESAKYLNVSYDKFIEKVNSSDNTIPIFRIDGKILARREALDNWMRNMELENIKPQTSTNCKLRKISE